MEIKNTDASVYLGRKAGRDCMDSIKHSENSIKIVSPYLSPKYIRELIKLKDKGVRIRLITSDNVEESEKHGVSHKDIIKQDVQIDEKRVNIRLMAIIISSVIFLASLPIMSERMLTGMLVAFCSIVSSYYFYSRFRTKYYSYHSIIDLKVFDSSKNIEGKRGYLIHSKIYVIDEEIAYLGSTNFTENGFVNSYESSIKIKDKEGVKKISEEIDWLFENSELEEKDIGEWGREIYDEPLN